jgi:hypothetical protein
MTRELVFIPVGSGDSFANYKHSVANRCGPIYWGGSSVTLKGEANASKFFKQVFSHLKVGDVLAFVRKDQVEYTGVVTDLRQNQTDATAIGWLSGDRPWDLIIEMTKVPVTISGFIQWLDYGGSPNSSCRVNQLKCERFWKQFGHLYSGFAVGAISPVQPMQAVAAQQRHTYYTEVDRHTTNSWRKHREYISADGTGRSTEYHLDHMYSKACGEAVGVPAYIIGSKHNLALLSESENTSKGARCSQSLSELLGHFPGYEHLLEVEHSLLAEGKLPWQHGKAA